MLSIKILIFFCKNAKTRYVKAMDFLSSSLEGLRLRQVSITILHPPEDFDMHINAGKPRLHFVDKGELWLSVHGGHQPERLTPGDMAFLPTGAAHDVWAGRRTPVAYDQAVVPTLLVNKQSDDVTLCWIDASGAFDEITTQQVMAALPPLIVIRKGAGTPQWLETALRLVLSETRREQAGAAALAARVVDLAVVHAVRRWVVEAKETPSWLAGAADLRLGKAMAALHANPAAAWTVPKLAAIAGMSRSSFADHFQSIAGFSPGQYIVHHRLARAAQLLRDTRLSIGAITSRVGFASPATFSRAFRGQFGLSPLRWRQREVPQRAV